MTFLTDFLTFKGSVKSGLGLSAPGPANGDAFVRTSRIYDQGRNLFDPDDVDCLFGYYVLESTGNAFTNYTYNTTGYIPVEPGETYIASSGSANTTAISNRRCFYDKDRNFLSGTGTGQPPAFTIPAGAAYVRLVILRQYWPLLQLEKGEAKSNYTSPRSRIATGAPANPFRRELLRQTHLRLLRRLLPTPESVQINIAAAGDSYTHAASRWIGPAMDYLADKYGDGGGGWCSFGFLTAGTTPYSTSSQPSNVNGNVRPATYPTRFFGSPTSTYYTEGSADLSSLTLGTAGDYVFQAFPASPVHNGCDLHFIGVTGAQVDVSWGTYSSGDVDDPASYSFGAATTVAVAGTAGTTQIVSISSGMPAGQGAVKIQRKTNSAKICGVNLKSAADGVRIHKIAATGSASTQWNAATAGFNTSLASLAPQLFVYMDGPNSQASVTHSSWGSHVENLVSKARTAAPGVDVLIMTPPENQRTTITYVIAGYAVEARRRAMTSSYAYHDLQPAFGVSGDPTEYGSAGAVPLFNADNLHPDPLTGGRLICSEFLRVIEPT